MTRPLHICTRCGLPRDRHLYPNPDPGHLFTDKETNTMPEVETPLVDRAEKPPCAVCGKQPTSHRGRCSHKYETMSKQASSARAANRGHKKAKNIRRSIPLLAIAEKIATLKDQLEAAIAEMKELLA
jgi:hypothetical protein